MNPCTNTLKTLSEAPECEIDPKICIKLRTLSQSDNPTAAEMKSILDECAYYALASDFAMRAMDFVWQMLLVLEAKA